MKKHLLRKSLALSLALVSLGYGYAEAGVLTPGAITPGTYTLTGNQIGIDTGGTYTVGTGSETVTFSYDNINEGRNMPVYLKTGDVTYNGNMDINALNCLSYSPNYFQVVGDSTMTINGNLNANIDHTSPTKSSPGYFKTSGKNAVFTVNGDTKIVAVSDGNNGKAASFTTVTAGDGSTMNFNGNFYLSNKLINYHNASGGANGIYASGNGATINFNGDKTQLLTIGDKPDTITSYSGGVVNINSKTIQIVGSIDMKDNTRGSLGTLNAVLDGSDSFWYGDILNKSSDGNFNVTLQNGAEYIPFGTYSENIYGAKKYVNSFTLNKGGIIDLADEIAQKHWQEYGLTELWPELATAKLDYLMIGNLKGSEGIFQLDMNDTDKSKTDMIYILNSTDGAKENFIQSYSGNEFKNITSENTLRFATVAAPAADKLIFKDSENIYGKSLWDYKLLIGHSPYDLSDSENAIYNGTRDGLTAAQIDSLMTGGTNWFIYSVIKDPSMSTLAALNSAGAGYDVGTQLDRYNKRHGEAKFLDPDSNVWVRLQRGAMGHDAVYDGNYTMGELGYETGKGHNHYGIAFEYLNGKFNLKQGNGYTENTRKSFMFYDTITKADGSYLDLVGRIGRVYNDLDALNTHTGVPVKGNYSNSAYSLSAEYGRKLQKQDSSYFFEPQAQLQYTRLGGARYATFNGTDVHLDSAKSLIGRLGFRVGRNVGKDLGNANAGDSTVYFKADILREFSGGRDIHMTNSSSGYVETYDATTASRGTWYDIGIGADLKLSKKAYFTCDLERSFGSRLGKNWEANLAFKLAF